MAGELMRAPGYASPSPIRDRLRPIARASPLWPLYRGIRGKIDLWRWQHGQSALVPHQLKQAELLRYRSLFNLRTLLETGTHYGDMVDAMKDSFHRIISIELDDELFHKAVRRFERLSHVRIIHGDSGLVLPGQIANIHEPCLFWLDGHYSGGATAKGRLETPIRKELASIFASQVSGHVVLIDDARCFTGTYDYPTLTELRELSARAGYGFYVADDIIRIHE